MKEKHIWLCSYKYLYGETALSFFLCIVFSMAPKRERICLDQSRERAKESDKRVVNARFMMSTGSSFACEQHARAFVAHIYPGALSSRIINATERKVQRHESKTLSRGSLYGARAPSSIVSQLGHERGVKQSEVQQSEHARRYMR